MEPSVADITLAADGGLAPPKRLNPYWPKEGKMAFDSRVYRVLIASPSDVEEEREAAVRVIQEWNDLHSHSKKVVLLPLRWETHTAPEYGTRPQEVINRTIVDQCDLLVGIFWTRLGSPTGTAHSGTLEEIDRAGKAGKPVMLYFSRVPIDPDRIDAHQNQKLREFKEQTYPKGLVETYKTPMQFRDKFAKQLELKVRDLQRNDSLSPEPLSLQFLGTEDGSQKGNNLTISAKLPVVADFDAIPPEREKKVKALVADRIREASYVPLPIAIHNHGASGIRSVYIELQFKAEKERIELTDSPGTTTTVPWLVRELTDERPLPSVLRSNFAQFDPGSLQEVEGGWGLTVEWDAVQPQRIRVIKPILYAYPKQSATLTVVARVFGEAFPEPVVMEATIKFKVQPETVGLNEIAADWEKKTSEPVDLIERLTARLARTGGA